MKRKQEAKKWVWYLSLGVILIVLYKTLDNFTDIFGWIGKLVEVLMPFIIAIVIAYIFYIPSRKIENKINNSKFKVIRKISRPLSVLLIYLIVFVCIFIIIKFIIPIVTQSISDLALSLPGYYKKSIEFFSDLPEESIWAKLNIDDAIIGLQKINISEKILGLINLDNISQYIKGVMGIAGIVFDIFVVIVISIYLLLERTKIKEFLKSLSEALFEKEMNKKLNNYYSKTNRVFFSFISSQILDAFIMGFVATITLLILKVKYGVLLGFLIGLFNIIPYFGAIVAVLIAGIITLFTGGITKTIWMLIIIVILQQIDANVVNPKIIGVSLKISPILVIFSVTIFGAYFGVLGMFLAVPITAMLKVLVFDFIEERKREKSLLNIIK